MRDRSYPGLGERPNDQGWYALAFYEHSRRPECQHEHIYILADANPEAAQAQFKINNFSNEASPQTDEMYGS